MDHDEAIRRSIPFLQELESRLLLTLTDPVPAPPGLCARLDEQPDPQETRLVPLLESPQETELISKSVKSVSPRLPR